MSPTSKVEPRSPAPFVVVECTIPAGETVSAPIDASVGSPVLIIMPDAWFPEVPLGFQISVDGGVTFVDTVLPNGDGIVSTVLINTAVLLAQQIKWATQIRLRSGYRYNQVPQEGDRTFKIVLEK